MTVPEALETPAEAQPGPGEANGAPEPSTVVEKAVAPNESTSHEFSSNILAAFLALRVEAIIAMRAAGRAHLYPDGVLNRLNATQRALFLALEAQVAPEGDAELARLRAIEEARARMEAAREEYERLVSGGQASQSDAVAGQAVPVASTPKSEDELYLNRAKAAAAYGDSVDVACPKCGFGKGNRMPRGWLSGFKRLKCQQCQFVWDIVDGIIQNAPQGKRREEFNP